MSVTVPDPPSTCQACKHAPIVYLVLIYNTETGRMMWVCHDYLEESYP